MIYFFTTENIRKKPRFVNDHINKPLTKSNSIIAQDSACTIKISD